MRELIVSMLLVLGTGLAAGPVRAVGAPTHFVNAAGPCSDGNSGTSPDSAWCSLDPVPGVLGKWKGDMVVQVSGPVVGLPPNSKLSPPAGATLTIAGSVPAVDGVPTPIGGDVWTIWQPANLGARAQLEPRAADGKAAVLGPAGQGAPDLPDSRFGAWSPVTLTTAGGVSYTVWQAPNVLDPKLGGVRVAAWAPSRQNDVPLRIPVWAANGNQPALADAPTWASAALGPGNQYTTWGLFADKDHLYLIPPPDGSFSDPNTVWIWVSAGPAGLPILGPDVTVSDLAFVSLSNPINIREGAARVHLIHDDFRIYGSGVTVVAACCSTYSQNHTIEQNRFSDDGNWLEPGAGEVPGQLVSWPGFKKSLTYGSGLSCSCFRSMESAAILDQGGSIGSVYQNNTVWGGVDGFDHYPVAPGGKSYDDNSDAHLTIQNNYFTRLSDDALDQTGNRLDLRVVNNRMDWTDTFISLAPTAVGPVTIQGNVAWETGSATHPGEQHEPNVGYFFKIGAAKGSNYKQPLVWVTHNTFWTDVALTEAINPAGGNGPNLPKLSMDHNIFRQESSGKGHIISTDFPNINEDYNDWSEASPSAPEPFKTPAGNFDNIDAWRAASGQGGHSNTRSPSLRDVIDPLLVDPGNGDVHIRQGEFGYAPAVGG